MNIGPPDPADAAALFDLVAAADLAELGYIDYELADAVEELGRPGLDLSRDAWVVAEGDGLAGYGSVLARPATASVRVELSVRPDAPAEVFTELLVRIRRRCAELAAEAGHPAVLAAAYASAAPGSRAAARLAADGWRPVRRFSRMGIDLDPDRPDSRRPPSAPPDIVVRAGLAADEVAVHAVLMEAFTDHFDSAPETLAQWQARVRSTAGYDRELFLLAEADRDPVAALIGRRMAEQGWIGALGVRPAYRGRGLGRLLLRTAFAEFARRGFRRVELGVDNEGTTGAYRLYESAGMQAGAAHDCYQVEIPAAAGT